MLSGRRAISNSPHSSEGVTSNINTPDTKLAVYSPEELRVPLYSRTQTNARHAFDGMANYSVSSAGDPFVGPGYPYFTSTNFNFPRFGLEASKSGLSHESPARTVNHTGLPTPSTNSRLSKLHYPEGALLASPFNGPRTSLGLNSGDVGSPYLPPKSRAFVIEGVSSASSQLTVAGIFSRRDFESIRGPYLSELKSSGKFVVAFTDLRDTRKALERTHVTHPEWRATSLSARDCAQELNRTAEGISDYEGQISVQVMIRGHPSDNDISHIANYVQGLVKSFGALSSFKPLYYQRDNTQEYLVEFCDTVDAANAVAALNGASIEGLELGIKHVRPDVESTSGSLLQQLMNTRDNRSPNTTTSPYHISGCARDHSFVLSPTGRSTVPMDEISDIMGFLSPVQKVSSLETMPQHTDGRFGDQRPKHPQNVVNVDRIRQGLDVRTTIMLRNIPNKVDLSLLKNIVDETSFGRYDFMYLRIDFANNCNVGYAFINFEDPIDIIDFVEARAGRTWNCFNSDKVAEVSYATIQGRECLIQKFRNSSVMLEDPSFRPKLFYTGTGPLAGNEEPFPPPNNMSKMRRSVENAEQVGLFAPRMSRDVRRGQGVRPEQTMPFRNGASPPQLEGLSNITPMTSPLSHRR